jgi:NAD(P)-dependent dehydrogenase (short-subunit alcohol dehydrogenase family)
VPVNSKTWLITGASSGLGFALAQYVLEQGDCAVLGARNLRPMSELVAHYPDTGLALTLDVTRHEDRAAAIVQAEGRFGGIDVLVKTMQASTFSAQLKSRKKEITESYSRSISSQQWRSSAAYCQGCVCAAKEPSLIFLRWMESRVCQ